MSLKFTRGIVRKLSKNFQDGLTSSDLGKPDYNKAIKQHLSYIKALKKCGLKIIVLKNDERFPDSTFVEDTAVVNKDLAIITNLGAPSRRGEEREMKMVLEKYYDKVESIENPGTLEGGDVLKIENDYFIGLSSRTNSEGANQFKNIVKKYGYSCSIIPLINFLHLKTGVAYVGANNLVISGELVENPLFKDYNLIKVEEDESYASNCIKVNDYILMAKGYKKIRNTLRSLGYKILEINVSEFRKMDGGLSCLSLRF
ncbi:MAG: dimethylarginine dimethylaminohydrolase family protein [Promethearchaeota archaeon]|jgi:dimethylargininase